MLVADETRQARGKLLAGRGEVEEGERLAREAELEEALSLYERKGNLVMAERTRSRLVEVARSA
jgi:hypothetical protein